QRRLPWTAEGVRGAGLVRAAIVLVRDAVAVPIGPRTAKVLLRTRKLGAAVDVVRDAIAVAVGERGAAVPLRGTGRVRAEILAIGNAVAVAVVADHRGNDRARRLRRRLARRDRGLAALARLGQGVARRGLGRGEVRVGAGGVAAVDLELGKAEVRLGDREIARRAGLRVLLPRDLQIRSDRVGAVPQRGAAGAGAGEGERAE